METKTYYAKDQQTALEQIKAELGPDAIIVKSRKVKERAGLFGLFSKSVYEVTVSYTPADREKAKNKPAPAPAAPKGGSPMSKPQGQLSPIFAGREGEIPRTQEEMEALLARHSRLNDPPLAKEPAPAPDGMRAFAPERLTLAQASADGSRVLRPGTTSSNTDTRVSNAPKQAMLDALNKKNTAASVSAEEEAVAQFYATLHDLDERMRQSEESSAAVSGKNTAALEKQLDDLAQAYPSAVYEPSAAAPQPAFAAQVQNSAPAPQPVQPIQQPLPTPPKPALSAYEAYMAATTPGYTPKSYAAVAAPAQPAPQPASVLASVDPQTLERVSAASLSALPLDVTRLAPERTAPVAAPVAPVAPAAAPVVAPVAAPAPATPVAEPAQPAEEAPAAEPAIPEGFQKRMDKLEDCVTGLSKDMQMLRETLLVTLKDIANNGDEAEDDEEDDEEQEEPIRPITPAAPAKKTAPKTACGEELFDEMKQTLIAKDVDPLVAQELVYRAVQILQRGLSDARRAEEDSRDPILGRGVYGSVRVSKKDKRKLAKETFPVTPQEAMDAALRELIGRPRFIRASGKNNPRSVVLFGPTGVGKTTTLAKLAASCVLQRNGKVAMINADVFRVGAKEQLQEYADILKVPMRTIYDSKEIAAAMASFADSDFILIDTCGKPTMDPDYQNEIRTLIELGQVQEKYLVVSSTVSCRIAREIVESFDHIENYKLIVTKLDESRTYGSIVNLCSYSEQPIAYLTDGQNVPDNLRRADVDEIIAGLWR